LFSLHRSQAQRRRGVVSPDFDTTQHAHAQKKANHSGQAERSGQGCLGVSPDYGATQHASAKKKAKRSRQAERRVQRSRGIRGSLPTTTIHFAGTPSAVARQSEAENREVGFGVSPDFDTTQHAHAQKKAKRCGQDERS